MGKIMKITVTIEDESGEILVEQSSERAVPYIEEIEQQGFRSAFHDLEVAVLELRQEAGDSALSEYLEQMSKKKPKRQPAQGGPS